MDISHFVFSVLNIIAVANTVKYVNKRMFVMIVMSKLDTVIGKNRMDLIKNSVNKIG